MRKQHPRPDKPRFVRNVMAAYAVNKQGPVIAASKEPVIVDDIQLPVLKLNTTTGEQLQYDPNTKRILRPTKRQITTPKHSEPFAPQAETVRFVSSTVAAEAPQRLRVHSDGKVHTSLDVLAKAHQTHAFGRPERIISDAHLFNELTQRIHNKKWLYTQRVLPLRKVTKLQQLAPNVNASVLERVGELFTAVLLFKGKGYNDVKRDLALALGRGEKTITYNVNTTITYDQLQFTVGRITVKKTVGDGIFFCSHSCKPVQIALQGLKMASNAILEAIQ